MAADYKTLGQVTGSGALVTLYTVPSATHVVVSSIVVCNITNVAKTFRIAIRPAGAAITNKHYLVFNGALGATGTATQTITYKLGITLGATDVISVLGSDANVQFSAFGQELT